MIEAGAIERAEGGGGSGWLINHLPTILWHRRIYVIIPAVLLFVATGGVTAYFMPVLLGTPLAGQMSFTDYTWLASWR